MHWKEGDSCSHGPAAGSPFLPLCATNLFSPSRLMGGQAAGPRCSPKACVRLHSFAQRGLLLLSHNELIKKQFQLYPAVHNSVHIHTHIYKNIYTKTNTVCKLYFFCSLLCLLFLLPMSSHELHNHGFIFNYPAFQHSVWKSGKLLSNIVESSLFSGLYKYLDGDINHTGPRANRSSSTPKEKNNLNGGQ